jgi:protein tyrosine phosphatase (PTP) superfamily phosphohydrolase (DUF442 family)
MKITSEMPVGIFRQFFPAVPHQNVTLTEENIDAMRTLARDWDVPVLAHIYPCYIPSRI